MPLTLGVPAAVRASHTMPGQYVSIVVAGENGFFVLASPVGAEAWGLLVKGGGTVADALLAEPVGAEFSVSGAQGDGFPCREARGRRLVVAAAGTGIAAVPSLAALRIAEGDARRTTVLLGLRVASDLPCASEVAQWRSAGARVLLCVSRDEVGGADAPADIARGYVQDVARLRVAHEAGTMAFAVGPPAMIEAIRALGPRLGAAPGDVRTNY